MKQQRWSVSAGTPDMREGERGGWIDMPAGATEEEARAAYLAQRPDTWVIHTIHPDEG